jgi:hypothetical protein
MLPQVSKWSAGLRGAVGEMSAQDFRLWTAMAHNAVGKLTAFLAKNGRPILSLDSPKMT